MTLVAGREVWLAGIPDIERLTILGRASDGSTSSGSRTRILRRSQLGGLSAVAGVGTLAATAALGLAVTNARSRGLRSLTFLIGAAVVRGAVVMAGSCARLAFPLFAATLLPRPPT